MAIQYCALIGRQLVGQSIQICEAIGTLLLPLWPSDVSCMDLLLTESFIVPVTFLASIFCSLNHLSCSGQSHVKSTHYCLQKVLVVTVPFPQQIMDEECKLVGSASCCDCREIVWKIMEQVKAESDQWTEMQDMLEQVRLEMQELQSSRDTWQHRAMASDISLRSLNSQVSRGSSYAYASIINVIHVPCKCTEALCVDQVKTILNGLVWCLLDSW